MHNENNPVHMDLASLTRFCAQETEHFFHKQEHDPRYCFELFRRAIREGDQPAWEMIYNEYHMLVSVWVERHPGFETSGEETQYFVTGAFGKISRVLTSDKFNGFSDLKSLLSYLKMCVHSVIVDYNRQSEYNSQQISLDELEGEVKSSDPDTEDNILKQVQSQEFWEWIKGKLQDEKERLVIQGLFVHAMKPREVCDFYRQVFSDVDEVYRIKQNILARLRRDSEFLNFLGLGD